MRLERADALDFLPTLDAASVDIVITDPPYSSGGAFRGDRTAPTLSKYVGNSSPNQEVLGDFEGDSRDQRGYLAWSRMWMAEARRVSKPGAVLGAFTDWRQLPITTDALQAAGWIWRGLVSWDKVQARPQLGRYTQQCEFMVWGSNGPRPIDGPTAPGSFSINRDAGDKARHIAAKPARLLEELLRLAPPGGVVLDPFTGSGSTAVACRRLGLDFIGCEISPEIHARTIEYLAGERRNPAQLELGGAA